MKIIIKTFSLLLLTGFIFLIYQNIMAFRTELQDLQEERKYNRMCLSMSLDQRYSKCNHQRDRHRFLQMIQRFIYFRLQRSLQFQADVILLQTEDFFRRLLVSLKEEQIPGSGYELTHKKAKLFWVTRLSLFQICLHLQHQMLQTQFFCERKFNQQQQQLGQWQMDYAAVSISTYFRLLE